MHDIFARFSELSQRRRENLILLWLACIAGLVYALILVGGATRLTDSGLSITQWQPLSGALPPMSDADWQTAFAQYQTTHEYRTYNSGMDMSEFRYIYWWEWGHRQLARIIGLVFALPLLLFWSLGWLERALSRRLLILLGLGALQAGIGWWMVASGIGTQRTDVAPYRLMTHFGLALAILGYCFWIILSIRPSLSPLRTPMLRLQKSHYYALVLLGLVATQMLVGALTAGLDGGLVHNDWPLMSGHWLALDSFSLTPLWRNLFENPATAQALHRLLAYTLLIVAGGALIQTRDKAFAALLILILIQAVIGIMTLVLAAPLGLALLHQGFGVGVFLFALTLTHRIYVPA